MFIYQIGAGRVGTALQRFFYKNGIVSQFVDDSITDKSGILFLPISDSAVKPVAEKLLAANRGLFVVHFSAATTVESDRVFLLHPYSSVCEESDFSKILFTLWGKKNETLEQLVAETGLQFVYCGEKVSILYHTSAVLAGNFTQFFALKAIELLQSEGLSTDNAKKLIRQLVDSSANNVLENGISGLTGPAARGENEIIAKESNELSKKDQELAKIYSLISEEIKHIDIK